ncbi:MAG TPA: serine/threonine-protein kinase [Polyangia bacterium]|jgi:tetratricopeptide (TPR) repeat protein|nr:serine/threonine-protein kinase [Polyangia bacterium]
MQQDPPLSGSRADSDEPPERTVTTGAAQLRAAPATNLTPGAVIDGRYQIEASIGEGGSGSVFRAWDRALGEPIAIKILHPERAREKSWINRLAREVRVARAIRHPNVCRVFDLGHADGHWFVTMELADGGALRQLLRAGNQTDGPRPLEERLADARSLCAGLAAIHAVGFIHRDVTPQNVLRMTDGRLVLSDFGLAIENNDNTTVHGGTPAYMPPEALMGGRSDQRSDVWQLGAILHEIMFGRKPEWRNGPDGTSMKWPLPAVSSPVEEEVARLCGDCLAHDPVARPPTAMAVAGRLAAAEVARPRGWLMRRALQVRAFWRQHRALRAAAVAAVLAAGVVRGAQILAKPALCRGAETKLAGVWDPRVKAEVRKAFFGTGQSFASSTFWSVNRLIEDYVQRWSGTYIEACEATQVRGEQSAEVLDLRMSCLQDRLAGLKALTALFSQADGAVVENAATAASQLGAVDRCNDVKLLRSMVPPPENPVARRQVEQLQSRIADTRALAAAGRLAEAEKATALLVEDARRVKFPPALAEALALRGRMLIDLRNVSGAEDAFEEGLWAAEEGRHDETKAEIAVGLISVMSLKGAPARDTERGLHMAEATLRRIGGHERLQMWMNTNFGAALEASGRADEALGRNLQALAIGQRALRPDDPDVIFAESNIGNTLLALERPAEALAYIDKAIEIGAKTLGADHPQMALQLSNRAEALNQLGRWAEARAAAERAMAIWEKQLPKDHLYLSYGLANIGQSYLGEGKPAPAVRPLERALRIRLAKEPSPAQIALCEFALGRALWDSGAQQERARDLAVSARDRYGNMPAMKKRQDEVVAWLGKHRPPVVSAHAAN